MNVNLQPKIEFHNVNCEKFQIFAKTGKARRVSGGPARIRTEDQGIMSPLL